MESLPKDPIFTFPPDTLNVLRKKYDLDKPGAMDRAIDILEMWIKKQDHFTKKEFSRAYLERSIIRAKGSVERTKERLDKLCTARVTFPQYYVLRNVKEFVQLNSVAKDATCPKLTEDYYRVYIIRAESQEVTAQMFHEYYIRAIYHLEYAAGFDYANGLILIIDYRKLNLYEFVKYFDMVLCARLLNVALTAYGLRLKQIHCISKSKIMHFLVSAFKQLISEKLGNRIHVHDDIDSLHKYVSKDVLPEDCGGNDISLTELSSKWADVFSSEDFMAYIKDAYEAKIDENLRPLKELNNDYLGIQGTFRSLSVD